MQFFPQLFLSSVKSGAEKPFLFERHAKMFISQLRRDAAGQVNQFARALHSIKIEPDMRVAFCALPPSIQYWVSEMALLSIRGAAVIIPSSFPVAERIAILTETRSKAVVVATLAEATTLAQAAAEMKDLAHIICLQGKAMGAALPIHHWREFAESGRMHPDHMAETLSGTRPTDTALLFYTHTQGKLHKVQRYSHEQLLSHVTEMDKILGQTHPVNEGDIVLTSPSWDYPAEHIASCFLPVFKRAAIQINPNDGDFTCLENQPHVLIAPAPYLEKLRAHIEKLFSDSGKTDLKMLNKAVSYGKQKYESKSKLGVISRFFDKFLRATVVRKVSRQLGRLRLIIGADDSASYETQLFFHTFGAELVEVPTESLKHLE